VYLDKAQKLGSYLVALSFLPAMLKTETQGEYLKLNVENLNQPFSLF